MGEVVRLRREEPDWLDVPTRREVMGTRAARIRAVRAGAPVLVSGVSDGLWFTRGKDRFVAYWHPAHVSFPDTSVVRLIRLQRGDNV